jgi:2-amino-4-hydroxy-6-hydroxymethyldihydropteridine diphosphokinase
MEKVVLGLGSNVGNRQLFIRKAIKEISLLKGLNVITWSSVYQTEPWGLKNQRNFLNCTVICLCKLSPMELFKNLKKIEKKLGKKNRGKWAPREIDIDILFFGNHIIKNKSVKIPHPMIAKRNFVLIPLMELVPDLIHPVLKKKISVLLKTSRDKCNVFKYN